MNFVAIFIIYMLAIYITVQGKQFSYFITYYEFCKNIVQMNILCLLSEIMLYNLYKNALNSWNHCVWYSFIEFVAYGISSKPVENTYE